jgi:hypothetical protein
MNDYDFKELYRENQRINSRYMAALSLTMGAFAIFIVSLL